MLHQFHCTSLDMLQQLNILVVSRAGRGGRFWIASQGQVNKAGAQEASPQPHPQLPLDGHHQCPCMPELNSQLPGPGFAKPMLTTENSSQYSMSCLFITLCLLTPNTLLLEVEDEMSQGSMSKGTFFCRGKMRGSWEGYLGMGAAALADHLQLPHQCKETQGHTYFFTSDP